MKRNIFLLVAATFFSSFQLFAQINSGGSPKSFRAFISDMNVQEVFAPRVSQAKIDKIVDENDRDGTIRKIALNLPTNFTLENSGQWTTLANGDRLWRLKVTSLNAKAILLGYDNFHIPNGASLFVFSPDRKQKLGAFTTFNNPENGVFATEMIYGQTAVLEYYEPARVKGQGHFTISDVGHMFRDAFPPDEYDLGQDRAFGDAQSCQVNVNCSPVGDSWQEEKKGILRLVCKLPSFWAACTGSVVNNVKQDCAPLVLTALHCADGATANDLDQWIFLFNYEASGCTNPSSENQVNYLTMSGCTSVSSSGEAQTGGGSDYLLLRLKNDIPSNYNTYYNGWDASLASSSSGASIHHPSGDIKKISTYSSQLFTTGWNGSGLASHWLVTWSANLNGHGVTEGGSSGSPLFDSNERIIGTLTGGASDCNQNTNPDLYGKMSYHWNQNAHAGAGKLKDALDPDNLGITSLDGSPLPCGTQTPQTNFTANVTTVSIGQTVNFSDQSLNNPTSWSWNFGGGGTPNTSTAQNPSIVFNEAGTYTVSLTATNAEGSDTETKTNYITVLGGSNSGCDTISNFKLGEYQVGLYGVQNGGYLSGTNGYGDLGKYDRYQIQANGLGVKGVGIAFAKAHVSAGTPSFDIVIYSASNGTPGGEVMRSSVPYSQVSTDGSITFFDFPQVVDAGNDFFMGVEFAPDVADTLALFTSADGSPANGTAWEKMQDGSFAAYSASWGINVAHAIFPVLCDVSTSVDVSSAFQHLNIFPNPTRGFVQVDLSLAASTDLTIDVFNALGQSIDQKQLSQFTSGRVELDLQDQDAGVYYINFRGDAINRTETITILK